MALVHIQSLLARIYTDAPLRQRFLLNPDDVAREYHLEDFEIKQIMTLSKSQVENFAVSLIYKRLGEIRKKLFLTARLLGKKFPRLFFEYAKKSSPRGVKKHLKDTFLFTQYIKRMADKEEVPPWILEVMQYEVNGMKMFLSPVFLSIAIFRYDIKSLMNSLLRNDKVQVAKRIRIGVWIKYLSKPRMYHKIF